MKHKSLLFLFFTLFFLPCFGKDPSDFPSSTEIRTKFARLNPSSLIQNLAFYELYPETKEGQKALQRAQALIHKEKKEIPLLPISLKILESMVYSFSEEMEPLCEKQLECVQEIGTFLANRSLKGYQTFQEAEILSLKETEIDIARATLLLTHPENKAMIQTYEAYLDFMALQILASLPKNACAEQKIDAINQLLFFDLHFTFPANSSWSNDIGHYTFLSSVMEKRKGVCLGVSILYLSLAQRLDIPLKIVTPPGHIFVRYQAEEERNIETTARGIHISSENYLSIETPILQERTKKEVIGLALMNEASTKLEKKEYESAALLYEKALLYIPEDPLIQKFLGYTYLFLGKKQEALPLLKKTQNTPSPYMIYSDHITEDFLENQVDEKGIEVVLSQVEETKESLLQKQEALSQVLQKYPLFKAGLFQLASTYMQLHKEKEALHVLERLFLIDKENPTINYYLSSLYLQRGSYLLAWKHFFLLEQFLQKKNHHPKIKEELKRALSQTSFQPPPSFFLVPL